VIGVRVGTHRDHRPDEIQVEQLDVRRRVESDVRDPGDGRAQARDGIVAIARAL
jgi:hypothetical protein